jgi:hypothetical protein
VVSATGKLTVGCSVRSVSQIALGGAGEVPLYQIIVHLPGRAVSPRPRGPSASCSRTRGAAGNATHAWRSRTATRCWRGRATARRRRAPWRGMSSWRTATACASTSWSPARADRGAGGSAHGGLAPAVSARRGQSLRHGRLRRRSARRREYSARGADHHAAAGFDPHVIDAFFRNLLGAQASKSASAGSLRSPP